MQHGPAAPALQRRLSRGDGPALRSGDVLGLQGVLGNQAIQRMIGAGRALQRDDTLGPPPNKPLPPIPGGPPNKPLPPVPGQDGEIDGGTLGEAPKKPLPPIPGGPPNKPLPPLPGEELGQSPEVWAKKATNEAYMAAIDGRDDFLALAGARLTPAAVNTVATAATDIGIEHILNTMVTDTLSLVVENAVGERDKKGKVKRKKKKVKLDRQRFAGLIPDIDAELKARATTAPAPGSKTPKLDEFKRVSARVIDTKTKKKGLKKKKSGRDKLIEAAAVIAAQKGAESALKKAAPLQTEATAHRGAIETKAKAAAQEIFDQQQQFAATLFYRDVENANLLVAAFQGGAPRRDLIESAERLLEKLKGRDNDDLLATIETAASQGSEAAAMELARERAPKAAAKVARELTKQKKTLEAITNTAKAETDKLLNDPAFKQQAVQEAMDEALEGKMNSALKVVAKVCGQPKKPGDSQSLNLIIRIPVDPTGTGFVGFQLRTTSRRHEDGGLRLHAELNLVGGAKIPGVTLEALGQLGGYFDLRLAPGDRDKTAEGQALGNMLSYAMYRRFRESHLVPDALVDHFWGLKGKSKEGTETTKEAKKREAETWGAAVEEGWEEGDWAETGGLAGARAQAGIETGLGELGIKGGVGVLTGKRYSKKSIAEGLEKKAKRTGKKASMTKMGAGVTTLRIDGAATIGPLTAGADFYVTFRDHPKEDEDSVIEARLDIYAQGMVMKKALYGDPPEAAIRLATWIAEMALFGNKIIEQADKESQSLKKGGLRSKGQQMKFLKKGQRLVPQPYDAGAALFGGQWQAQHEAFEQQQAILESTSTIDEVVATVGGMGSDIGTGAPEAVSELGNTAGQVPGAFGGGVGHLGGAFGQLGSGNLGGFQSEMQQVGQAFEPVTSGLSQAVGAFSPALSRIGDLKQQLLDKTAGLKLNLGLEWPADGAFTGTIALDYVKRTGILALNTMKTMNVVDITSDKATRLLTLQFAPSLKFNHLYEDVDLAKLKATKDYVKKVIPGL